MNLNIFNIIYNPIRDDVPITINNPLHVNRLDIDLLMALTTQKSNDTVTMKCCNSIFLEKNLKNWLCKSSKCPVCKHDLKKDYDESPWNSLYFNKDLQKFYTPQVINHLTFDN